MLHWLDGLGWQKAQLNAAVTLGAEQNVRLIFEVLRLEVAGGIEPFLAVMEIAVEHPHEIVAGAGVRPTRHAVELRRPCPQGRISGDAGGAVHERVAPARVPGINAPLVEP
jgi:hypothetical protein